MSSDGNCRKRWLDENELHIVLSVIEAEQYNDLARKYLNNIMENYKLVVKVRSKTDHPIERKYIVRA
jgi:hypothetical protein